MHLSVDEALDVLRTNLRPSPFAFDLYAQGTRSFCLQSRKQSIDLTERGENAGIGIRLFERRRGKGRYGFSVCTCLTKKDLLDAMEQAKASRFLYPWDRATGLPHRPARPYPLVNSFDPLGLARPRHWKEDLVRALEEAARKSDARIRSIEGGQYDETHERTTLVTSEDLVLRHEETSFSLSLLAVAKERSESESYSAHHTSPFFHTLNPFALGKRAAREAARALGAKHLPSGTYTVVLENVAATELLEQLAPSFSARAVQQKSSRLAGQMGKKVFAETLNLVDDPTLSGESGSMPFDGEGIPTQATQLVRRGCLETFLYDAASAHRDRRLSNGHAIRPSFRHLPTIGPTHLSIEPGEDSFENLLGLAGNGVLIRELLGVHTINAITGDFSLGAFGYRIRGGGLAEPIRDFTLSGNLFSLFSEIFRVGRDLYRSHGYGSPSLLCERVALIGQSR